MMSRILFTRRLGMVGRNIQKCNMSTNNSYKPEKKLTNKDIDNLVTNAAAVGGLIGSALCVTDTYIKKRNDTYTYVIKETSIAALVGLFGGICMVVLSPLLVPVATVVTVVYYFDPYRNRIEDKNAVYYYKSSQ